MKTVDFTGQLTPNGQIAVPPDIAAQVPAGMNIQVDAAVVAVPKTTTLGVPLADDGLKLPTAPTIPSTNS